jgi:hypothetical protein
MIFRDLAVRQIASFGDQQALKEARSSALNRRPTARSCGRSWKGTTLTASVSMRSGLGALDGVGRQLIADNQKLK